MVRTIAAIVVGYLVIVLLVFGLGLGAYSGIGPENHKMMLAHYQQTKNLLVAYSQDKLGFF